VHPHKVQQVPEQKAETVFSGLCPERLIFIAIFKNSANQNGIFAICSLRMLLVH
jgi:hypothetical protein